MTSGTITNRNRSLRAKQRGHRRDSVAGSHQAPCASCGKPTSLPFKPTAERPGYCPACFGQRRARLAQAAEPESRGPADASPHPDVFAEFPLFPSTRAALSRMGITTPTPIQEQSIPALFEGRDVVGQAQTGSGKTLAFGIPLIEGCHPAARGIQGLVLVPTRELAIQVASVLDTVTERRVSTALLYGGRSYGGEKRTLLQGPQIVVGTPGRTLDHLRQGTLDLHSVRMLVLDEADEMLDRGFARDVEAIIAETPSTRQTALFSATLPDWVATTAHKHLNDPLTVRVQRALEDTPSIEHLIYRIDRTLKMAALQTLLDQREEGAIIVFGKTKHGVQKLAKQLAALDYPVGALQGNLSQNAREKVMASFRSGEAPVLVATNVAARGLDVAGVEQVINFDLPDSPELFTHRIGRTGRMGRSGEAITFVTQEEEKKWREIQHGLKLHLTVKRWGANGPEAMPEPAEAPKSRPRPQASRPSTAPQRSQGKPAHQRAQSAPAPGGAGRRRRPARSRRAGGSGGGATPSA